MDRWSRFVKRGAVPIRHCGELSRDPSTCLPTEPVRQYCGAGVLFPLVEILAWARLMKTLFCISRVEVPICQEGELRCCE